MPEINRPGSPSRTQPLARPTSQAAVEGQTAAPPQRSARQGDVVKAETAKLQQLGEAQRAEEKGLLAQVLEQADKDATGKVDLGQLGSLVAGFAGSPGPRTPAEARRNAEALFIDRNRQQADFRTIECDAKDANATVCKADVLGAQGQLEANKSLEETALSALSPSEQAQYQRIVAQTRNDPMARLALQVIAIEGRLTARPPSHDGKTLLQTLDEMTTQPLARGLDRASLVSDLIQEIAVPSCIAQKDRGTCTVTSLQIMLAMTAPAEYARLVSGLATPGGRATLANGDTLPRLPGAEQADGTPRTASSRLFQTAMMDYANGSDRYRNTKDGGGLDKDQLERAIEGVLDRNVDSYAAHDGNRADLMRMIDDGLRDGPVLVAIKFGQRNDDGFTHSNHQVLVTGMDRDRVYYTNPWGKQESMSRREFTERLKDVNFSEEISRPGEAWTAVKDFGKRVGSWFD